MSFDYVLDTNICIYIVKQKPQRVLEKFKTLESGSVGMSLITHAELLYGANRSNNADKAHEILEELVTIIPVIDLNLPVADHYADIRADLANKGMMIGNNDLWIAAHTREMNKILVTHNVKEFSRVENLKLENWVE